MMLRPLTENDLKDKGLPFACDNCGNKPTADDVLKHEGSCAACGDTIITYTVDAARLIIKMQLDREGDGK